MQHKTIHRSIRLTDEDLAKVKATGRGLTATIRDALNLYWKAQEQPSVGEQIEKAILDHERLYHVAQKHHNDSALLQKRHIIGAQKYDRRKKGAEDAEAQWEDFKCISIGDAVMQKYECEPQSGTIVSQKSGTETHRIKQALTYVLAEFKAGREPMIGQVAAAVSVGSRPLGKALSKLGIRSKTTTRGGKSVRVYPIALKAKVRKLAALEVEELHKLLENSR